MIEHDRPDNQGQDFTLTTKQVAEDLGISPDLVRRLKSDNSARLVEGEHWVKTDQNICLWSTAGLAELRAIRDPSQPCETLSQPCEPETPSAIEATEPLTLDTLAADFDNALRPHAQRVARERVARRFERLVAEAEAEEMQRIISLAGEAVDDQSFAAVLDQWEAVSRSALDLRLVASRNGHKQLTGVNHA